MYAPANAAFGLPYYEPPLYGPYGDYYRPKYFVPQTDFVGPLYDDWTPQTSAEYPVDEPPIWLGSDVDREFAWDYRSSPSPAAAAIDATMQREVQWQKHGGAFVDYSRPQRTSFMQADSRIRMDLEDDFSNLSRQPAQPKYNSRVSCYMGRETSHVRDTNEDTSFDGISVDFSHFDGDRHSHQSAAKKEEASSKDDGGLESYIARVSIGGGDQQTKGQRKQGNDSAVKIKQDDCKAEESHKKDDKSQTATVVVEFGAVQRTPASIDATSQTRETEERKTGEKNNVKVSAIKLGVGDEGGRPTPFLDQQQRCQLNAGYREPFYSRQPMHANGNVYGCRWRGAGDEEVDMRFQAGAMVYRQTHQTHAFEECCPTGSPPNGGRSDAVSSCSSESSRLRRAKELVGDAFKFLDQFGE